jgi:transcriptional regulator with XRE-family HTH domain
MLSLVIASVIMTVKEAAKKRNWKAEDLAGVLDCSIASAYRYMAGERPNAIMTRRIIEEFAGAITLADLVPEKPKTQPTGTEG